MLCSYCQINEANFTLKNGKACCSPTYQSCPGIKAKIGIKISAKLTEQYKNGIRESHFKKLNDGSVWRGRSHKQETKDLLSNLSIGRKMPKSFSDNRSTEMKSRYLNGWESKAGRTKKIDYVSSIAGSVKLDGSWELAVAKFFDLTNTNWVRNKKRFDYTDSLGKTRTYCPDFYLPDSCTYIEVKGYTTELDRIKWNQFNENLEVWDKPVLKNKGIL
jgi:hypothetical protein